jgi:hypothetical protein
VEAPVELGSGAQARGARGAEAADGASAVILVAALRVVMRLRASARVARFRIACGWVRAMRRQAVATPQLWVDGQRRQRYQLHVQAQKAACASCTPVALTRRDVIGVMVAADGMERKQRVCATRLQSSGGGTCATASAGSAACKAA